MRCVACAACVQIGNEPENAMQKSLAQRKPMLALSCAPLLSSARRKKGNKSLTPEKWRNKTSTPHRPAATLDPVQTCSTGLPAANFLSETAFSLRSVAKQGLLWHATPSVGSRRDGQGGLPPPLCQRKHFTQLHAMKYLKLRQNYSSWYGTRSLFSVLQPRCPDLLTLSFLDQQNKCVEAPG